MNLTIISGRRIAAAQLGSSHRFRPAIVLVERPLIAGSPVMLFRGSQDRSAACHSYRHFPPSARLLLPLLRPHHTSHLSQPRFPTSRSFAPRLDPPTSEPANRQIKMHPILLPARTKKHERQHAKLRRSSSTPVELVLLSKIECCDKSA